MPRQGRTKPTGRSRLDPPPPTFGEPDGAALAELATGFGWLATAARFVVYGEAVSAPRVAEAVGMARAAVDRVGGARMGQDRNPTTQDPTSAHPGAAGITIAETERRGVESLCGAVELIASTVRLVADGAKVGDLIVLRHAYMARTALDGFFASVPDAAIQAAEQGRRGGWKGTDRGR